MGLSNADEADRCERLVEAEQLSWQFLLRAEVGRIAVVHTTHRSRHPWRELNFSSVIAPQHLEKTLAQKSSSRFSPTKKAPSKSENIQIFQDLIRLRK
jgi:hypothetical protein